MKYVVTQTQKAIEIGIDPTGHFKKNDKIILNEKEVMQSPFLEGDIESRVKAIEAKLYTQNYTKRIIKTEYYVI